MTRDEYDFWTGPMGCRGLFAHTAEASELDHLRELHAAGRLTLADRTHQVAPGIELIQVGGHTPGQAIVTVATAGGPVILASDAVHYYEELERRPAVLSSWPASRTCTPPSTRSASSPKPAPASSPGTTRWWPNGSASPPTRRT